MSRESSPFIFGEYWLDKRRDGKSTDIWQIATYSEKSRSVVYRSTKRRTVDVEEAKAILRAYEAQQRSTERHQDANEACILPHLVNYIKEHGPDVVRLDTVKSSFRAWAGFLAQDELGTGATIADIDKNFAARFRRWRMAPHEYEIEWGGKIYRHQSQGVSGKTVQRNVEDLRAALHHAEANHRIEAPKVPSVSKNLRPKNPRQTFSLDQLGALFGYAQDDEGVFRELCLMLATGCRPGNAMAFDPAEQWHEDILDLQPKRKDLTDKRAAVLPAIEPLKPILRQWRLKPHDEVKSRKRWWNTARRALGLSLEAYSIRTTVSTHMDAEGVPGAQISGIIGHLPESRNIARTTSEHYLGYDPHNAARAKEVLTTLFEDVMARADQWRADHLRTIPKSGKPISIARKGTKSYDLRVIEGGGR